MPERLFPATPRPADAPLRVWTIFDRPADYPTSTVARLFLSIRDRPEPVATAQVIISNLESLRGLFKRHGLVCIPRADVDPPNLVESWL